MATILGTWMISKTSGAPFVVGDSVAIIQDPTDPGRARVTNNGVPVGQGTYDQANAKVVISGAVYWEFVGSEPVNNTFFMFGYQCGTTAGPDALGAWVSDPQGAP